MNDTEQARLQVVVGFEYRGVTLKGNLPDDQNVGSIDDRQHRFCVMLDDHHRHLSAQFDERFHNLVDDGRHQALERADSFAS